MSKGLALLRLLRPEQWVKNLFLFIPIFFAGEVTNALKFKGTFLGVLSFCMISSLVYIINDYRDLELDRQHPDKCNRPLASGIVTKSQAWYMMFAVGMIGLGLSIWLENLLFGLIIFTYFLLSTAYSFGLKKVSILDIVIVASGFVLRTMAGGVIADVKVSQWMVVMIFLLALFLVMAKRRDDILVFNRSGKVLRAAAEQYNIEYVNSILVMLSGIIIVSYLMYVISPDVMVRYNSEHLYLSSVFVIVGVMRYLQLALVENRTGSPTQVFLRDKFIQLILIGWVITFTIIIYWSTLV